MASKKWDEAVNSLRQWREEILKQEEVEKNVIILAMEVVQHIHYDKSVLVRMRTVEDVEVDGQFPLNIKGGEIDIPSFKQILTESGFYVEPKGEKKIKVGGIEEKEVIIEVSAVPISTEANEDESVNETDEQES